MSTAAMSEKMQEASEATEAAIQQNGLEDAASSSSTSSGEEVQPPSYDTKGDEERSIDEAKEALLKVIIPLKKFEVDRFKFKFES